MVDVESNPSSHTRTFVVVDDYGQTLEIVTIPVAGTIDQQIAEKILQKMSSPLMFPFSYDLPLSKRWDL